MIILNLCCCRISKLYEVASFMYILPHYRFTVYAIGIALGFILRHHKGRRLTKTQLNLGWFLATAALFGTFLASSRMSSFNYEFNRIDAALYSSIAPIPWCLFLAWTIYTAHLGYKRSEMIDIISGMPKYWECFLSTDLFVKFLEWRGFQISTKLSYGIYLVQFAVFHFNIGSSRGPSYFSFIRSVVKNLIWVPDCEFILNEYWISFLAWHQRSNFYRICINYYDSFHRISFQQS